MTVLEAHCRTAGSYENNFCNIKKRLNQRKVKPERLQVTHCAMDELVKNHVTCAIRKKVSKCTTLITLSLCVSIGYAEFATENLTIWKS
jgi:hypothetical protein